MIRYAREKGAVRARWINALLEKKPARLVSVAVANKTARIAWALLIRKDDYRVPVPARDNAFSSLVACLETRQCLRPGMTITRSSSQLAGLAITPARSKPTENKEASPHGLLKIVRLRNKTSSTGLSRSKAADFDSAMRRFEPW
jgi:hypothetical protein